MQLDRFSNCFQFYSIAGALAFSLPILVMLSGNNASASDVTGKAQKLLQLSWQCPPQNEIVTRLHLSWGTAFDRSMSHTEDGLEFVDQREQILHNFEKNDLTSIHLKASIHVPIFQIASAAISDGVVTLNCINGSQCVEEKTSTALSDDCGGVCGGQPWLVAKTVNHATLRFCSSQSAEDAVLALKKINSSVVVGPEPTEASTGQLCWVTDPSNTPLNVRASPNGKQTGRVLTNSTNTTVLAFVQDPKGRSWARVAGNGYVFSQLLTCLAPEMP